MKLQGEQRFESPRDDVWETLLDAQVLEDCIPGAESIEQTSEDTYEGTVTRGLASVSVTMELSVEIVEDDRPESMTVAIEGKDNRINSTVSGEAEVDMTEGDGETLLEYEANLDFTGKLASLGARLIKRAVNRDLKTFFKNVEQRMDE